MQCSSGGNGHGGDGSHLSLHAKGIIHLLPGTIAGKPLFQTNMSYDFGPDEEKDHDDILPDTNIDRERTLTGKIAIGIFVLGGVFVTLAFVTPNWIEGDPKFYGTKVERVGLWVHCLRSLADYNDLLHQRYYAGCRWLFNPFTEGYAEIRNYLAPRKNLSSKQNEI